MSGGDDGFVAQADHVLEDGVHPQIRDPIQVNFSGGTSVIVSLTQSVLRSVRIPLFREDFTTDRMGIDKAKRR